MVPASLTRPAAAPLARDGESVAGRAGWRPANLPRALRAELRALTVWGALLGGLSVLVLLGHVWVRLKVVEAGYRLSATQQLVERLELEGRELAVRAAAADRPGQLEELARARLGMRPARRGEEAALP